MKKLTFVAILALLFVMGMTILVYAPMAEQETSAEDLEISGSRKERDSIPEERDGK